MVRCIASNDLGLGDYGAAFADREVDGAVFVKDPKDDCQQVNKENVAENNVCLSKPCKSFRFGRKIS